jgi:uncharacterized protein YggU (UPF0235/DUF167 family)
MSLGDLDELIVSCRSEDARSYVSEAVACYKAGAFRACIVGVWIAIVYDLLAKIGDLALGGDPEAQKITHDVAALRPKAAMGDLAAIRRILEIERDIVLIANEKFDFFDGQQLLDLKRIQDDRNRCAHPTYQGTDQPYSPSAELARAHLVHAVRHVLSAPPVQGKAATAHIVRLVESDFFPTEISQAKVQLKSGGLDRPKDSLVRSVTDHLVFGMFEGDPALKGQRRTAVGIGAIYELFPGLSEPRLRKALNTLGRRLPDQDLKLFFGLQRRLPQTWSFLEQDNQTRLAELVKQSPDELAILILPICFEIAALEEVCRARVSALDHELLGLLLQKSKNPMAIARAIDIYCSSKSWEEANAHYTAIEPVQAELSEAQIFRILAAPKQERADLNGAHSFTKFVQYVWDHKKVPHDAIIATLHDDGMDWLISRLQEERVADDDFPF